MVEMFEMFYLAFRNQCDRKKRKIPSKLSMEKTEATVAVY
jgi:hypothetical protein